jgi:hypothetical protein
MHVKKKRSRASRRVSPLSPPADIVQRLETLACALDGASAEAEVIAQKVREDLADEQIKYTIERSILPRKDR